MECYVAYKILKNKINRPIHDFCIVKGNVAKAQTVRFAVQHIVTCQCILYVRIVCMWRNRSASHRVIVAIARFRLELESMAAKGLNIDYSV